MTDIDTVNRRCPGVLEWGGVDRTDSRLIFKVRPDEPCLEGLINNAGSSP